MSAAIPAGLEIHVGNWQAMRTQVSTAAPEEACGLLAQTEHGEQFVIPVENEAHSPVRFRMRPVELLAALERIEAEELDLVAIYHSHPAGPRHPSAADLAEHHYPDALVLIWYPILTQVDQPVWECQAYQVDPNGYTQIATILKLD